MCGVYVYRAIHKQIAANGPSVKRSIFIVLHLMSEAICERYVHWDDLQKCNFRFDAAAITATVNKKIDKHLCCQAIKIVKIVHNPYWIRPQFERKLSSFFAQCAQILIEEYESFEPCGRIQDKLFSFVSMRWNANSIRKLTARNMP